MFACADEPAAPANRTNRRKPAGGPNGAAVARRSCGHRRCRAQRDVAGHDLCSRGVVPLGWALRGRSRERDDATMDLANQPWALFLSELDEEMTP